MMKRAKKKEIEEKLNEFTKEIGETDLEFSASVVPKNIENLKPKAKDSTGIQEDNHLKGHTGVQLRPLKQTEKVQNQQTVPARIKEIGL